MTAAIAAATGIDRQADRIARGLLEAGDDDEVAAGAIKAERLGARLSADC